MNLDQRRVRLEEVRKAVSSITHDINNPLSIISGNAQLLKVLVEAEGLGDDFMQPVQDIEEASERVAQLMVRLNELKEQLAEEINASSDAT